MMRLRQMKLPISGRCCITRFKWRIMGPNLPGPKQPGLNQPKHRAYIVVDLTMRNKLEKQYQLAHYMHSYLTASCLHSNMLMCSTIRAMRQLAQQLL